MSSIALCVVVAALLITAVDLANSSSQGLCQHNVAHINRLSPLFSSRNPHVTDVRNGDLAPVAEAIRRHGAVVLLLYAPWCAVSKRAARTVNLAAKRVNEDETLRGRVDFVAVDCWCPAGECRRTFNLVSFPRISIYRAHDPTTPVDFVAGVRTWQLMNVIRRVLEPWHTLNEPIAAKTFLSKHETVLLGHFKADDLTSETSAGYQHAQVFQAMAGHALHVDANDYHNLDGPRFALTTSQSIAQQLQLPPPPSLTLASAVGGNTVYHGVWSWQNIKAFAIANSPDCVTEFQPKHRDNDAFKYGPVVLLFLPLGDGRRVDSYLKLYRRISLPHCRCRWTCSRIHANHHARCCSYQPTRVSLLFAKFYNSTADSGEDQPRTDLPSPAVLYRSTMLKQCPPLGDHAVASLRIADFLKECGPIDTAVCDAYHSCQCGVRDEEAFNPDAVLERLVHTAAMQRLARGGGGDIVDDVTNDVDDIMPTDRRLSFRYVDIVSYGLVAQRLGMRETARNISLLIVDSTVDRVFVLDEEKFPKVNSSVTKAFIRNFTLGRLEPRFLSESSAESNVEVDSVSGRRDDGRSGHSGTSALCTSTPLKACIVDVTGDTFAHLVLNTTKYTFLMYHLPSLGLSMASLVPFVETAKQCWSNTSLQFARIRMDRNRLPPDYTPQRLPAFVLFSPAARAPLKYPKAAPVDTHHFQQFLHRYYHLDRLGVRRRRDDRDSEHGSRPSSSAGPRLQGVGGDQSPVVSEELLRYASRLAVEMKESVVRPAYETPAERQKSGREFSATGITASDEERLVKAVEYGQLTSDTVRNASERVLLYQRQSQFLKQAMTQLALKIRRLRQYIAAGAFRWVLRRDQLEVLKVSRAMEAVIRSRSAHSPDERRDLEAAVPYLAELTELHDAISHSWEPSAGRRRCFGGVCCLPLATSRQQPSTPTSSVHGIDQNSQLGLSQAGAAAVAAGDSHGDHVRDGFGEGENGEPKSTTDARSSSATGSGDPIHSEGHPSQVRVDTQRAEHPELADTLPSTSSQPPSNEGHMSSLTSPDHDDSPVDSDGRRACWDSGCDARRFGDLVLPKIPVVSGTEPAAGEAAEQTFDDSHDPSLDGRVEFGMLESTLSSESEQEPTFSGDSVSDQVEDEMDTEDASQSLVGMTTALMALIDPDARTVFARAAVRSALQLFNPHQLACALRRDPTFSQPAPGAGAEATDDAVGVPGRTLTESLNQLAHTLVSYPPSSEADAAAAAGTGPLQKLVLRRKVAESHFAAAQVQQLSLQKHLANLRAYVSDGRLLLGRLTGRMTSLMERLQVGT